MDRGRQGRTKGKANGQKLQTRSGKKDGSGRTRRKDAKNGEEGWKNIDKGMQGWRRRDKSTDKDRKD